MLLTSSTSILSSGDSYEGGKEIYETNLGWDTHLSL